MSTASPIEQLRTHLFRALGLSALPLVAIACGGRQVADDEAANTGNTDDDDQGDASEDASEDEGSSSGSTSTSTSSETSTETSTSESTSDSDLDTGEPENCTVTFQSYGNLDEFPDCLLALESELGCANPFYLACTPAVGDQSCERQCPDGVCDECAPHSMVLASFGACGPYEIDGQCCSVIGLEEDCGGGFEGRPFIVDGSARLAALESKGSPMPTLGHELPEPLRRRLADRWARVAAAEHASVASFAQFALRLLAIGAPPTLIRDSFAAAGDEVRHAEAALALASRYADRPLRFGRLDVRGVAEQAADLESLVLACVREGCIGETLAALELATAATSCEDLERAALLRSIADDEARHAGLAWRFVQWALARDPDLQPKVAALFAALHPAEIGAIDGPEPLDRRSRRALRDHGCLPDDDRRRVEREGLRQLVRPCAAALLRSTEGQARATIGA